MPTILDRLASQLGFVRPAPSTDDTAAKARIASLEIALRERDEKIAAMKQDYAILDDSGRQASATAGQDQLEKLFRKLAAPLSTMCVLADMAEEGREVAAADIAALFRSVEKQLRAFGLEQTCRTGESTTFDPVLHQRMSGGSVSDNDPVIVRSPGYRFAGRVLLKGMVATPAAVAVADEEPSNG